MAVLAEALSRKHQVSIIHHRSDVTRERLAYISCTDLSAVQMRSVVTRPYSFGTTHNPWRRYKQARDWQRELSEPYDLFVNFTHGFPPFCHAGRGVLVVMFPFHSPPYSSHLESSGSVNGTAPSKRFSSIYHNWEWRRRLESYQTKTTISRFSRDWTTRRWGVTCEVVHPPGDSRLRPHDKRNFILSVGRFTTAGHSKKQLEMMTAFGKLQESPDNKWRYFSIGGLSDAVKDQEYFLKVCRRAQGCGAHVFANLDRDRLERLYGEARIFWHAAGYGEDECRPELSEHFGIVTVEAMSAGCIPVVIDKGGQPEIVEHGVSGFLWSNLEELTGYTELLMRDDGLRARMGEAAQSRAKRFSRENFVSRFLSLLPESMQ